MDCRTPGFPVHHQLLELTQTHSIEAVMPCNHLILHRPLLLPPSIFPSIRVFSNEPVPCIMWPKYWSFSFSISPPNEYSEGILFPLGCTAWISLHYKGLSRVFSNTTVQKHQFFSTQLSFFKKIIYFNWSLITLHYYCGFCHTLTWISHGCTCVPHPEPPLPPPCPSHPSGSSQCTSLEHPVLCIEPGLEICFTYDNIPVSMLFSQTIPPSPSPTESKRLSYTSVSLLVSHIGSLSPSF